MTKVNGNWAALEHYQGNYQKAIERNLMDVPYLEVTEQSKSLSTRYNNISRAYSKLEDYPLAIKYMSKAVEIDERENYKKDLCTHLLRRSTQQRKMGNYKAALSDYRRYKKVRDTVQNLERVKEFTAQKIAFEYEQRQLADSLQFTAQQEQLLLVAQSEREVCKLFRMDKNNQEIMELRGVSYSSIRSMRYRIRKKMDLENREELEQFLKEF